MDRSEFERLRDLPDKSIDEDVVLQRSRDMSPLLFAVVPIRNSAGVDARVRVELNEKTDSKTINVVISGIGPICRLDIDGKEHKDFGNSHKHSLKLSDCSHPSVNLSRKIEKRADLSGKDIKDVFTDFCQKANITHHGLFRVIP
jgi:hypothetical protein